MVVVHARGRQASAAPIGCRARGAAVLIIIFQPRRRCAPLTARRARGRGLGLPRQLAPGSGRSPPMLRLPGCSGSGLPLLLLLLLLPPPAFLPGRAACALASCGAAPPPCAPGVPAVRLAALRAGLTFCRRWRVAELLSDQEQTIFNRVLLRGAQVGASECSVLTQVVVAQGRADLYIWQSFH
ncbi:uncharacterized protein [Symphalangus syndactylus]|uniref:uncharacterized protein n=1 Tax=Symphalangus syndactylus TaxID=9590 RepID=UPI003006CB2D